MRVGLIAPPLCRPSEDAVKAPQETDGRPGGQNRQALCRLQPARKSHFRFKIGTWMASNRRARLCDFPLDGLKRGGSDLSDQQPKGIGPLYDRKADHGPSRNQGTPP